MNMLFQKDFRYELHKMREKCRGRDFGYIFSTPLHFFIFVILVLRALLIRLIPNQTTMYFIRKPIEDIPAVGNPAGLLFKVFDQSSDEIVHFAGARDEENKELIREIYLDKLKNRFNDGVRACALLDDNNRIVSIFFTSNQTTFVEQINFHFKPANHEIVITDIYTLMNMRRKGLYVLLLNHAAKYFGNQGFDSFVMWIMKHNRATIRAQLKAGFIDIFQSVHLFSWLGIKRISVNTAKTPLNKL
jgi:ribosomal protein S18 acetylase RimI-like enzyme